MSTFNVLTFGSIAAAVLSVVAGAIAGTVSVRRERRLKEQRVQRERERNRSRFEPIRVSLLHPVPVICDKDGNNSLGFEETEEFWRVLSIPNLKGEM